MAQLRQKDMTGNEVVTDWLCFLSLRDSLVFKLCSSVAPNKQTNLFPPSMWGMQIRVIVTQNHSLAVNFDTKA